MAATNLQAIVDTYGCMPEYQEMKSFFANSKNSAGIADATAKYGTPKENTKSYNTGWGIFKKNWGWKDFCDWQNIGPFYAFAKLSVQFPTLKSTNKLDCFKVKSAVAALESEKATLSSVYKDENVRTYHLQAINDKIEEYNSFFSTNACDLFILDKANKAAFDQAQAVANTQANASKESAKLGVYVFGGVAAFIGLAYAFGIISKKTSV